MNKGIFDPYNELKRDVSVSDKVLRLRILTQTIIDYTEHIREEVFHKDNKFITDELGLDCMEKEEILVNIIECIIELKRSAQGHAIIEIPFTRKRYPVQELVEKMNLFNFLS